MLSTRLNATFTLGIFLGTFAYTVIVHGNPVGSLIHSLLVGATYFVSMSILRHCRS